MRSGIAILRDAIEVAIQDVRNASLSAEQAGDRAAQRNIHEKIPDLEQMKKSVIVMEAYLGQPKYKGYFGGGTG